MSKSQRASQLSRKHRLGVFAATLLAPLCLMAPLSLLDAGSAAAADDALELANDGVNYSALAAGQLFDHVDGFVPGESRTGSVWVRNTGQDPAVLSVGVTSANEASMLPAFLEMGVQRSGTASTPVRLAGGGACRSVARGLELAPGQFMKLELTLALVQDAPNGTRQQSNDFGLLFLLQDTSNTFEVCDAKAGPLTMGVTPPGTASAGTHSPLNIPGEASPVSTAPASLLPTSTVAAGTGPQAVMRRGFQGSAFLAAVAPGGEDLDASRVPNGNSGGILPSGVVPKFMSVSPQSNVVGNNREPEELLILGLVVLWLALKIRRRKGSAS
ncbi:hypothetical protein [Arthrobacter cryoconiti]|uniref:PEP-CTERM protein-sorting domain-containing protein n=1 Tax=Arthrobacter cryoconiti TaxID=748907 RepID=A0ABV8R620_9MICC|nr:hypothetical protein [Arthrobacter cryoconiti]MCC9067031.1 hypothetical protein [Arthrobacter cryoconiti]